MLAERVAAMRAARFWAWFVAGCVWTIALPIIGLFEVLSWI